MDKILPTILLGAMLMGCSDKDDNAEKSEAVSPEQLVSGCLEGDLNKAGKDPDAKLDVIETSVKKSLPLGQCISTGLSLEKEATDKDKAQKVLDFVSDYVGYELDFSGTRMPANTLFERLGDCEDFSALVGAILVASGVDYYLIERPAADNGGIGHVFGAIRSNEKGDMVCGGESITIVDATDAAATVGFDSNNHTYNFTCRLLEGNKP